MPWAHMLGGPSTRHICCCKRFGGNWSTVKGKASGALNGGGGGAENASLRRARGQRPGGDEGTEAGEVGVPGRGNSSAKALRQVGLVGQREGACEGPVKRGGEGRGQGRWDHGGHIRT